MGEKMVEIVGEIGDVEVRTEPLPDDGKAYGMALSLEAHGWENVHGKEVTNE
jgi:hypothetical protein